MMTADGNLSWSVSAYVMSYIIVANWTLLQVCVAILLDNFIKASAVSQQEREDELLKQTMSQKLFLNALDPLLEKFTVDHNDDADLSMRLQELFKVTLFPNIVGRLLKIVDQILDTDDSKSLKFRGLAVGIKKLVRSSDSS